MPGFIEGNLIMSKHTFRFGKDPVKCDHDISLYGKCTKCGKEVAVGPCPEGKDGIIGSIRKGE